MYYWHCRALREDGTCAWFATVESTAYADREEVRLPEAQALVLMGSAPASLVDLDSDGAAVAVRVRTDRLSQIPDLWFYEVAEAGPPAATVLMAFTGHGVPGGALRRHGDRGDPPAAGTDQLAAVRWYPGSGEVDQIYVAPDARRQGVATHLISVASALGAARGEPRMWGDGQRTDLGEAWVAEQPWSSQAAARTHVAPPMTPGDPG